MGKLTKFSIIAFFVLIWSGIGTVKGQSSSEIDLDIQAESVLTNAQIIELTNFVFDDRGRGPRLINFRITNNEASRAEQLYLDFQIVSQRRGVIMEAYQRNGSPFSLNAGQTVTGSNNALARGSITGVTEAIRLDGDLTPSGERLINSLQGRTTLPVDEYEIIIQVYQNGNRFSGVQIAHASTVIGTNLVEEDLSIYLQAPGEVLGTEIEITNRYPEFRWEGSANQEYRIVIVEADGGDTPETLIQSALSTPAAPIGQSTSLLEFENADVIVEGTSFQYPASGVQPFQDGRTYYWQVFTSLTTTSGEETRSSDIWNFTFQGDRSAGVREEIIELDDDVQQVLMALLGAELFGDLMDGYYQLEGFELDGIEYSGAVARDELMRLIEKIQEGKIKVVRE